MHLVKILHRIYQEAMNSHGILNYPSESDLHDFQVSKFSNMH